ncbi:MAG: NUDIX hydrolase [Alphaproteobacteria bacterium]|nr:NUDIX hydrolase [Alphaproteobacteria bacterium]MDD9919429.1 NUDIX hydrolase [Alphaproteobacteria bacterium]
MTEASKKPVLVPVVAGVILQKAGKFLLVQEKQPQAYGLWNLPAGKVDEGDTIEETAIKEAFEETGYHVELIKKMRVYQSTATEPPKHAFTANILSGSLTIPEDEILDAGWFSLEEIEAMTNKLRCSWVLDVIKESPQ